jgi:hypothetical protein
MMNKQYNVSVAHTETTRYLCAAAHFDERFRDYVLSQVVEEKHKAIGELYGTDIIAIVNWCLSARLRTRIRDCILFLIFVIVAYPIVQDIIKKGISIPYGYEDLLRLLSDIVNAILNFLVTTPQAGSTFIAAWFVVLVEIGISYYGFYGRQLTQRRFGTHQIRRHSLDKDVEEKLRYLSHVQDSNVVVYSGYLPFVGAGSDLGAWSFTVDISRGAHRNGVTLRPHPFQVQELYNTVASSIYSLGLNNLIIEDKLYVNGQEIRDDRRFISNPFSSPYVHIDPRHLQQFVGKPDEHIRHYKCIRITSWKGELILSIFFRFVPVGKNLFIEANYLLLPPLHKKYYEVDSVIPLTAPGKLLTLLFKSFFQTIILWLLSPLRVLSIIFHGLFVTTKHWFASWQIWENQAFDYGTKSSLREVASAIDFRRYFQRLDREMYTKIVESQLLTSIIDLLDAKDIDTSNLKERREMILNHGIIVSGGSFYANNLAVGERAKAILSSLLPKATRRARKVNRQRKTF